MYALNSDCRCSGTQVRLGHPPTPTSPHRRRRPLARPHAQEARGRVRQLHVQSQIPLRPTFCSALYLRLEDFNEWQAEHEKG